MFTQHTEVEETVFSVSESEEIQNYAEMENQELKEMRETTGWQTAECSDCNAICNKNHPYSLKEDNTIFFCESCYKQHKFRGTGLPN